MIDCGIIEASIVAVHDPRQRRARAFADAVEPRAPPPPPTRARSPAAVMPSGSARPPRPHRDGGYQALAAGSAVFCEKPLDRDLAGATAFVGAVAAAGVASQCGLVLRSAPVFRALRDLVRDGSLGVPMAAVFRDDQYFPIQGLTGRTGGLRSSSRAGGA